MFYVFKDVIDHDFIEIPSPILNLILWLHYLSFLILSLPANISKDGPGFHKMNLEN